MDRRDTVLALLALGATPLAAEAPRPTAAKHREAAWFPLDVHPRPAWTPTPRRRDPLPHGVGSPVEAGGRTVANEDRDAGGTAARGRGPRARAPAGRDGN